MGVKTGVNIDPDNYQWLKDSGNISKKLNECVALVRNGGIQSTPTTPDTDKCIQPLAAPREFCHYKKDYPELRMAANGLLLVKEFCTRCPFYIEDIAAKKKASAAPAGQKSVTPPKVKAAKVLEFTIKCTDCEQSWDSLYFEDRDEPLFAMHHAIASHVKLAHGRETVLPSESCFRRNNELKQEMQSA